jgi:Glycogen debranching enzyme
MTIEVNRRQAIAIGVAGSVAGSIPLRAWAAEAGSAPTVADPRTCELVNPLSLGDLLPRFSWTLTGDDKGLGQTAYRIRVARSPENLAAGRDLLWDSGKVSSADSLSIPYGGPALPSRAQAVWDVELWPGKGARSVKSAPATFETGLAPGDWKAQWLASETTVAKRDREAGLHWISPTDNQRVNQTCLYRWTFDSDGGPAEICLSAHEMSDVTFNGSPVKALQDGPISWTQMAVYPVTLKKGRNVLALAVKRIAGFGVPPAHVAALLRHGRNLESRMTSADAGWKTHIGDASDWQSARFDDSGWKPAKAASGRMPVGEPWPVYPANLLRRTFTAKTPIRSARLYATALGVYDASINGKPVSDRFLAPEFTDPSKRVLYQAYDVTDRLTAGENTLGFHVGDGWYGSKYSTSARFAFGPAPCRLLAQLEIEYEDGTREVIASGDGWQIAESPVKAHSIYDGEVYDARDARQDWFRQDAPAQEWRRAETVDAPDIPVDPQRCEPIRALGQLTPAKVSRLGAGHYVVDFGQNFAGWARLSVEAAAGTHVTMRFAELLNANGTVDQANLRTAWARDIYVAAGKGREIWMPRFTYHGFRYVELTGVPDDTALWSVEGVVGHQDLPITGSFRSGDPVITKFWENAVWSQKSNFWGLPTDCPQRDERLGWMGDAEVFWPAAAYNMDVAAFTSRIMGDMRAGQKDNGAFPDVIPPFVPGFDLTSPGWADAGVVLPYTAWHQYGDLGVIETNWKAMDAYLGYILAANPNHLWQKSRGADYGDWLAVDASAANPGEATTPKDLIGTAYWADDARMMAEMAQACGRKEDAARYRQLFDAIRTAFNTEYVKADGTIGNGSQTSYILAIRFGLLSDSARKVAGDRLVADIAKRGGHLSTGFLGTPHILDALAMSGHDDTAVALLLQRSYPSWGYMVEKGATTMWERWNSDTGDSGMNSRNHYAFGAIGSFLFRRIAGIDAASPGFADLNIAPIMDPRLGSGGATYRSAKGTIRTDWTAKGSEYQLDVELPAGVSGTVLLPGGKKAKAKPGLNRFSGKRS